MAEKKESFKNFMKEYGPLALFMTGVIALTGTIGWAIGITEGRESMKPALELAYDSGLKDGKAEALEKAMQLLTKKED